MRKTVLAALAAVTLAAAVLPLAACERKGPAERAGEKIDDAGQKLRDAVDPPKGPGEKIGRSIDRAVK
jgi:predicted small lipoprotein YifL